MNRSEGFEKMSSGDLLKMVENLRKELFHLKLNLSSGAVKDNSRFAKLRADIARILTFSNGSKCKSKSGRSGE